MTKHRAIRPVAGDETESRLTGAHTRNGAWRIASEGATAARLAIGRVTVNSTRPSSQVPCGQLPPCTVTIQRLAGIAVDDDGAACSAVERVNGANQLGWVPRFDDRPEDRQRGAV
jgi:hypothetical protein